MKKFISLTLILLCVVVLVGCNTGFMPTVSPSYYGQNATPHPNNVNFQNSDLTTNFLADNLREAVPNGGVTTDINGTNGTKER